MSRISWTLYDPELDEEYNLPVNPYEDGGSFAISKGVGYETVSGMYQDSLGNDRIGTIVFGTPDPLETFNFSGRTYDDAQHTEMERWAAKNEPVHLTDDLGRTWEILIDRFEPRRLPTMKNSPYKHSYTLSGIVLSEIQDATP